MDFENNPYDRVRGYQQVCRCRWHTFRFYAYNTGILILWSQQWLDLPSYVDNQLRSYEKIE